MQEQDLYNLRYPIGDFAYGSIFTTEQNHEHIAIIAGMPRKLTELVGRWDDERLDTPYRPDGWTVRQVVHHVVDSHINAYVRVKLALTENNPTISPYEEGDWAKLADYTLDVAPSLVILSNLHLRWVTVLKSLTEDQRQRTYFHPGSQRSFPISEVIGIYAWHGEHHYQHINQLAVRNGWV
ncbi:putative metal-dependent hydrolase [Spirosoma aureum]|uniref:Putative metal-dependent hydrolase n=1 Tax=Spirosoma aureum TaxID=2692134 RepID=A0A6G9AQQ6_9BACT|nr:putative metal-dependent hydrolase [Spirosoma aureum]QIP14807.1 putative metal-dependent hydrolase [Spirosoma aureum]